MQMDEAPVIVAGDVFRVRETTKFGTQEPDGAKVAVMSGDGATEVKLKESEYRSIAPKTGDVVAWVIRPRPYKLDNGNAGVSFLFVQPVTATHLDEINTALATATGK